jgi:hypothetical protein
MRSAYPSISLTTKVGRTGRIDGEGAKNRVLDFKNNSSKKHGSQKNAVNNSQNHGFKKRKVNDNDDADADVIIIDDSDSDDENGFQSSNMLMKRSAESLQTTDKFSGVKEEGEV